MGTLYGDFFHSMGESIGAVTERLSIQVGLYKDLGNPTPAGTKERGSLWVSMKASPYRLEQGEPDLGKARRKCSSRVCTIGHNQMQEKEGGTVLILQ